MGLLQLRTGCPLLPKTPAVRVHKGTTSERGPKTCNPKARSCNCSLTSKTCQQGAGKRLQVTGVKLTKSEGKQEGKLKLWAGEELTATAGSPGAQRSEAFSAFSAALS